MQFQCGDFNSAAASRINEFDLNWLPLTCKVMESRGSCVFTLLLEVFPFQVLLLQTVVHYKILDGDEDPSGGWFSGTCEKTSCWVTACQIFLHNLTLKGKTTASDSSSSSSFARQLVQQVGCEVLQHRMLFATKTLQEEIKSKPKHNKNMDELLPMCVLSWLSCTQSWKGQKRCHSAVVSTHFTC